MPAGCSRRSGLISGGRQRGDPVAELIGGAEVEQRDRVASGGAVDLDVREVEPLLEHAAGGLDVLHARHRDQRPADLQGAVADVDRLRAHVPPPPPPPQLGNGDRCDDQREQRQHAHQHGELAVQPRRHREPDDDDDAPDPDLLQAPHPAGAGGQLPARLCRQSLRANSAPSFSYSGSPISVSKTYGSVTTRAEVARRRRRRWLRWARARSWAASAERRAAVASGGCPSAQAARIASASAALKRSGHRPLTTIASSPIPTASGRRRSRSSVSLTGISSGTATAT